jgi:GxxExxY protein
VIQTQTWGTQMAANPTQIAANDFQELKPVTRTIIGAAMEVHNTLGAGFSEKVYENCLRIVLEERGLGVEQQRPVRVVFHGETVGDYVTDLLVGRVVVELKAVPSLTRDHQVQCINYLKATGLNVCLLLNFGRRRLEFKRFAMTHSSADICVGFAGICVP